MISNNFLYYQNNLIKIILYLVISITLINSTAFTQAKSMNKYLPLKKGFVHLKPYNLTDKPKLIFHPDFKNEKKIGFPKNIFYDIDNYKVQAFSTHLGIPMSYQMIPGNRYVISQTFYASGGSGSMDNIYIFDLKEPKVWHLASTETIGGLNSNYKISNDNKYLVAYDPYLSGAFLILKLNKSKENTPFIYSVMTKKQLENILQKKYKQSIEIYRVKAKWLNNKLQITIACSLEFKNGKYSDAKIIYNPDFKKIISIDLSKEKSISDDAIDGETIENLPNKELTCSYLEPEAENGKRFFKIVSNKNKKTIFQAPISEYGFSWINKNKILYVDENGQSHILKISQTDIEDTLISNLPKINSKERLPEGIFSNSVNSSIVMIINNNLYQVNFDKLSFVKITDFKHKPEYDKYKNLINSEKNPIVSHPHITKDGKRIFYCLDVGYYALIKLMTVEIPKN